MYSCCQKLCIPIYQKLCIVIYRLQLNMAEIEINIMDRQCTGGRIESKETLESNVTIWSKERNRSKNKIEWKFSRQDADNKLSKHYVS